MFSDLKRVNEGVNMTIRYTPDVQHYGNVEYWEVPTDGKGVCHAYALAKLHQLLQRGWDIKDLRIALGQKNGEWHIVLIASFDGRDYVLDNNETRVVGTNDGGIKWNRIQAVGGSATWIAYNPL